MSAPLLEARDLHVAAGRRAVPVLRGLDLEVHPGEILGIVGESGCGKSTLARALVGLQPAAGGLRLGGRDMAGADARAWREARRDVQLVFQDAPAALDPRMRIRDIVAEPLGLAEPPPARADRERRALAVLERVGLDARLASSFPHELSGGQCQRVALARAIAGQPKLLVCDEPVSALDVSVQAQIVNLLAELRDQLGMAIVFIAHDLAVVRHISDRVLVMYAGRVMETAPTAPLFERPHHPYTRALLDAVPSADPELARTRPPRALPGEPPVPGQAPVGCVFHPRCGLADDGCRRETPTLRHVGASLVACVKATTGDG